MSKAKTILKGIWRFCTYLLYPQKRAKRKDGLEEPLEVVLASDEEYVVPPAPADVM